MFWAMPVLVLGVILGGCASSVAAGDPFQVDGTETPTVTFDVADRKNVKVNETTIPSNTIILPLSSSYDFKFRVVTDRIPMAGFLMKKTTVGRATIAYDFKEGRYYRIEARYPVSSGFKQLATFGFAALDLVAYLYEDNVKVAEFPLELINKKEF